MAGADGASLALSTPVLSTTGVKIELDLVSLNKSGCSFSMLGVISFFISIVSIEFCSVLFLCG